MPHPIVSWYVPSNMGRRHRTGGVDVGARQREVTGALPGECLEAARQAERGRGGAGGGHEPAGRGRGAGASPVAEYVPTADAAGGAG